MRSIIRVGGSRAGIGTQVSESRPGAPRVWAGKWRRAPAGKVKDSGDGEGEDWGERLRWFNVGLDVRFGGWPGGVQE